MSRVALTILGLLCLAAAGLGCARGATALATPDWRQEARSLMDRDPAFAAWLDDQAAIAELARDAIARRQARGAAQDAADIADLRRDRALLDGEIARTLALRRADLALRAAGPAPAIDATAYGVVADGVADDGPALRRALAAAMARPGAILRLPAGRLRLASLDPAAGQAMSSQVGDHPRAAGVDAAQVRNRRIPHLYVRGAAHLTIAGAGAGRTELVLAVPWQAGIMVDDSRCVRIENLAIEHADLPFTQGRVLAVEDAAHYRVAIDAGFPSPLAPHIRDADARVTRYQVDAAEGPAPHPRAPTNFRLDAIEALAEAGSFRFTVAAADIRRFAKDATTLAPGDRVLLYGRLSTLNSPLFFDSADDCRVARVDIYTSPTVTTTVVRSGLVEFDRLRILPRPGTTRIQASNADGLFAIANRIGPWLHHSLITRNGDDYVNYLDQYGQIARQEGADITLRGWSMARFRVGTSVRLLDGTTYRAKGEAVVAAITCVNDDGRPALRLRLAGELPDLLAVPAGQPGRPDLLIDVAAANAGAVVSDNDLVFGWRLIFRNHDVLVARNRIINRSPLGRFLIFGPEPGNPGEGWRARTIAVRDNLIEGSAPLLLSPQAWDPKPQVVSSDLAITGNRLRLSGLGREEDLYDSGNLFDRRCLDQVEIAGNRIEPAP